MGTEAVGGEDPYAALGLEPRATPEEVERAYRFNLELYGEGALSTYSLVDPREAEAQRARLRDAYEILHDPERRRLYDEGHGFLPPDSPVLPFPARAPAAGGGGALELPALLTGPDLRRLREARGLSLRHLSTVTKIGLRFLEYIEEDRFAFLPPPVYLRGFLQEYGRLLGLEPRKTADAYMARLPKRV